MSGDTNSGNDGGTTQGATAATEPVWSSSHARTSVCTSKLTHDSILLIESLLYVIYGSFSQPETFEFSHCKAVASFTIFHKQICDLKTHVSYRLSEKNPTDLPTCKRNRDSIISFPWYQQIPNINVMGLPQEFYCDESVFLFPKPYYLWKVLCRCRGGLLERNVGVWDSGFSCLSSSNLYITDSSLLYIGD